MSILSSALRTSAVAAALSCSMAAVGQTPLTTQLVASGFTQPLQVTHLPGDFSRLFVIERGGRVKIIENGSVLPQPFLDISSLVQTSWLEWGLLGMCFDADYANNGFIYVNYSSGTGGDTNIARFHVPPATPNDADETSRQTVLFLPQPNQNHRGGWLGSNPADGYLYIPLGDGGGQNDPNQRAQNTMLLQGKILRVDPSGDDYPADPNKNYRIPPNNPFVGNTGFLPELWAYGLRNPWRASWDRVTGAFYIGDVGQNQREEIDYEAPGFRGGRNYGWRCTEGTFCTGLSGCTCNGPTLTPPIFEYNHSLGLSVTCGYVYRGCAIPDLDGTFFYADYQNTRIWSFRYDGVAVTQQQERTAQLDPPGALVISGPASFGEDGYGELYIASYNNGQIYKVVPATFVGPDCNANGRRDACDILANPALDADHNGIPDSCEPPPVAGACCMGVICTEVLQGACTGSGGAWAGGGTTCAQPTSCPCRCDFNRDGNRTAQDIFEFLAAFFGNSPTADYNGGGVSAQDIFDFLACFFATPCP